jgi:hypothetical protein
MSIKDMFLRKIVESKMKDIPAEEQEKVLQIMQKNPQLFQTIAQEVQSVVAGGKDQMSAMMDVMQKHKEELERLSK